MEREATGTWCVPVAGSRTHGLLSRSWQHQRGGPISLWSWAATFRIEPGGVQNHIKLREFESKVHEPFREGILLAQASGARFSQCFLGQALFPLGMSMIMLMHDLEFRAIIRLT